MKNKNNEVTEKKEDSKTIKFLKEHWTDIFMWSSLAIGGGMFIASFIIKKGNASKEGSEIVRYLEFDPVKFDHFSKECLEELSSDPKELWISDADMDIFTKVGTAIEEAVLDDDLNNVVLKRDYAVGDGTGKHLIINVKNYER